MGIFRCNHSGYCERLRSVSDFKIADGEQKANMHSSFAEFDEIGYWSEIKLEIVRDYASAYARILNSKNLPYIYIDAFAGAGQHISKGTGEFVPGSPQNALNVRPPFREYHFIDLNSQKLDYLQGLATGNSNVRIYEGDCNDVSDSQNFPDPSVRKLSSRSLLIGPVRPRSGLGGDVPSRTTGDCRHVPKLSGNGHESECFVAKPGEGVSRTRAQDDQILG